MEIMNATDDRTGYLGQVGKEVRVATWFMI